MLMRLWALPLLLSALGVLGEGPPAAAAPSVAVAAASDLVFCLEPLHAEFSRQEPGITLRVATGSSGNFFAQIQHGAPYDVFLSADLRYPRELIAAGAAAPASLTLYGIGRIVLWTRSPGPEPALTKAGVLDPRLRRFALAQPAHAPYGRAAQEALEHLGAWRDLQARIVLGENVAQVGQFLATGSADAGIVALSLVLAPRMQGIGRWVEIPAAWHTPLEQAAVLTVRGADNPAATRYLQFLRSAPARAIFERFGFRLPPAPRTP
jgi:molybdate transport system substrate-binding protein